MNTKERDELFAEFLKRMQKMTGANRRIPESEFLGHKIATTGVHGSGTSVLATTANIATHAALTTGVHGVGESTVASAADIATHAADTSTHGVSEVADAADIITTTTSQVASGNLRNSNDAERNYTNIPYTKKKECLLNAALAACRIKFDLCTNDGAVAAYGRIYKNGVAIGTERSTTTLTPDYETFTEDLSGFAENDLIQIYIHSATSGYIASVKNFRFYYDQTITAIGDDTLVTALLTTTDPTISITNQDP